MKGHEYLVTLMIGVLLGGQVATCQKIDRIEAWMEAQPKEKH